MTMDGMDGHPEWAVKYNGVTKIRVVLNFTWRFQDKSLFLNMYRRIQ